MPRTTIQQVDDAQLQAVLYVRRLEEQFESQFYGDRPPPPKPTLENLQPQLQTLRTLTQQMQQANLQPPQPGVPPNG